MKYILREPNQKFILAEAITPQPLLEDDLMNFDGEGDMMLDVEADTPIIVDYKTELINAEKANNQELVEQIWKVFYTDFVENELPGITVEDLENLGQAFRVECVTLGFTVNTNVFLQFLKNNKNLIKNMNSQSYAALHNSCGERLNGIITKEDLLSKGVLGKNNIIFCEDLYRYSADDVTEYLSLQDGIKSKISMANADKKDDLVDTFLQCFFKPGAIKNNITKAILLPIYDVKEHLAQNNLFDNNTEKTTVLKANDDAEIDKLITMLINSAPAGSEKDIALQAALNILSTFGSDLGQSQIAKIFATAKINPSATLNLDMAQIMNNNSIFAKKLKGIKLENQDMLQTILNKLGEKINK